MPYQPIERLLPRANGSVYKLVILASQRAVELAEGMPPLVEQRNSDKPTVLSLDEIADAKVSLKVEHVQEKPKEKEKAKKKSK